MSEEADTDAVFQALASATRRRMLDLLKSMPGASVNDVAKYFPMSRIGVMKHLLVLEEAGLLVSRKSGRIRQLYFNIVPLQAIHDRWTTEYGEFWATRALDLKRRLEAGVVRKPKASRTP